MAKRTQLTDTELAEELLRRLDDKIAATGNRNFAVARIKVQDALAYIQRGEREGRVETDRGQERTT